MDIEHDTGTLDDTRKQPTEKQDDVAEVKAGVEEIAFRTRELAIKEAELALRERALALTQQQSQRRAWRDPVILGIIAALIGFMSSVATTFFQGRSSADHRDDPVAETLRRSRRWRLLF